MVKNRALSGWGIVLGQGQALSLLSVNVGTALVEHSETQFSRVAVYGCLMFPLPLWERASA